jgi:hypothetical protein
LIISGELQAIDFEGFGVAEDGPRLQHCRAGSRAEAGTGAFAREPELADGAEELLESAVFAGLTMKALAPSS